MLNKKILAGGAGEEGPHVKLKVGSRSFGHYGWATTGSLLYGGISRVPVWEGIRLLTLFSKVSTQTTEYVFSGKTPEGGISIRRLDTGYKIKTEGSVESSSTSGALFTKADKDKEIPLTFDPPPTGTSKKIKSVLTRTLERRAW